MRPLLATALLAGLVAIGCSSEKSDPLGEFSALQDNVPQELGQKNHVDKMPLSLSDICFIDYSPAVFEAEAGVQKRTLEYSCKQPGLKAELELVDKQATWLTLEKISTTRYELIANSPTTANLEGNSDKIDLTFGLVATFTDGPKSILEQISGLNPRLKAPGTSSESFSFTLEKTSKKPEFKRTARMARTVNEGTPVTGSYILNVPGSNLDRPAEISIAQVQVNRQSKSDLLRYVSHTEPRYQGDGNWSFDATIDSSLVSDITFNDASMSQATVGIQIIGSSSIDKTQSSTLNAGTFVQLKGGNLRDLWTISSAGSQEELKSQRTLKGGIESIKLRVVMAADKGLGTLDFNLGTQIQAAISDVNTKFQAERTTKSGLNLVGEGKVLSIPNGVLCDENSGAKVCDFTIVANCALFKVNGREYSAAENVSIPFKIKTNVIYNGKSYPKTVERKLIVNSYNSTCFDLEASKNASAGITESSNRTQQNSPRVIPAVIRSADQQVNGNVEYSI